MSGPRPARDCRSAHSRRATCAAAVGRASAGKGEGAVGEEGTEVGESPGGGMLGADELCCSGGGPRRAPTEEEDMVFRNFQDRLQGFGFRLLTSGVWLSCLQEFDNFLVFRVQDMMFFGT